MKRFARNPGRPFAFTLLELVIVMAIIAIMVGMVAPAMVHFAASRAVDNFGHQIIGAAQYARAQSISEARIYHLNYDESAGQIWLTADAGAGTFSPPTSNYTDRYSVPTGVRLQVQLGAQPAISPMVPMNVQQQAVPQANQLIDGTQSGTPGQVMQNLRPTGQNYVEFQPTGRTDPATFTISDNSGHQMRIACDTPTDTFREVIR